MTEFKCQHDVADHTGFYFHECGRPAKRYFILLRQSGTQVREYRCGLHSRAKHRQWVEIEECRK